MEEVVEEKEVKPLIAEQLELYESQSESESKSDDSVDEEEEDADADEGEEDDDVSPRETALGLAGIHRPGARACSGSLASQRWTSSLWQSSTVPQPVPRAVAPAEAALRRALDLFVV